jgi:hypothetical protein
LTKNHQNQIFFLFLKAAAEFGHFCAHN